MATRMPSGTDCADGKVYVVSHETSAGPLLRIAAMTVAGNPAENLCVTRVSDSA